MAIRINSQLGDVLVNDIVIAKIAGAVANECYGVVGMAARTKKDGLANLLKFDTMTRGIKVSVADSGLLIELNIIVEYGVNISVICESIINNVKYKIENTTGLEVNQVIVHVEGVRVDE